MKEKYKDGLYLVFITLAILSLAFVPKYVNYTYSKKLINTYVEAQKELQQDFQEFIKDLQNNK